MSRWLLAILPLLGVVIGAGLQFLLSQAADRRRRVADSRTAAYSDYLRAVAAAAHLRSDEDLRDAHRDAADAKARIAIYGNPSVIKALARFEETGAFVHDDRSRETFVSLVSSMRGDEAAVQPKDLNAILFGSRQLPPGPGGGVAHG